VGKTAPVGEYAVVGEPLAPVPVGEYAVVGEPLAPVPVGELLGDHIVVLVGLNIAVVPVVPGLDPVGAPSDVVEAPVVESACSLLCTEDAEEAEINLFCFWMNCKQGRIHESIKR